MSKGGYYSEAVYDRRALGYVLIDGKESACTRMCMHCGKHWTPVKGSKRIYGFCFKCMGYTCGPTCPATNGEANICVPYDVYLLSLEGKVRLDALPIVGRVDAAPPTG